MWKKAYLSFCVPGADAQAAILKFQAGKHNYELDFKAFLQKNLVYGTVRKVCRRPKYVSPQDVQMKQSCNTKLHGTKSIPDYWDPAALPDLGFKRITLSSSSEEYQKVWNLFNRTLPFYFVQKIERIQNLGLWEVYQWQKGQMQKQNGGKEVDERQLFHGTSTNFVDAICQQNFDWRVCGLHGTSYGKGATLREMPPIRTTTANLTHTPTPCSWPGCWWETSSGAALPLSALQPRKARAMLSMTAA